MRLVVTIAVLVGALAAALLLLTARDDLPDVSDASAPVPSPDESAATREPDAPAKRRRGAVPEEEPADTIDEDAPIVRGALTVRVATDDGDAPIAGARVVAEDADGGTHEAVTGADGAAVFDPPIDSDYVRFFVTAAGRASGKALADKERMRDGGTVLVTLAVGLDVQGVVLDADTGAPLLGATVRAPSGAAGASIEATTDGAGFFRLASVPSGGDVELTVEEALHLAARVRLDPASASLTVRLAAAGRVRGVVTCADGSPADAARVVARWVRVEGAKYIGEQQTVTDAKGVYVLGGLPLGTAWSLTASKPGKGIAPAAPTVRVDAEQRDGVVDLVLRPTVSLDVCVQRPDGSPVAGARVWVRSDDFRHTAPPCGADGMRHIEGLPAAKSVVRVEAVGFPPREFEVDLAITGSTRIEARLAPGETVSGVVVDDRGAPIEGAKVTVRSTGSELSAAATTDVEGRFRAEGLAAGPCILSAGADHHAFRAEGGVTAPTAELRIVLVRRGSIRFELKPALAARADQLSVTLVGTRRGRADEVSVSADAGVIATECDPDDYSVIVRAPGFAAFVTRAAVAPGETTSLGVLELTPGIALGGRVRDGRGVAIEGADVIALPADDAGSLGSRLARAETDAEGRFRLTDLGAGRWRLHVGGAAVFEAKLEVDVAAGAPEVAVTLRRPGKLACTVVERGEPVVGLEVSLTELSREEREEETSTTDRSGVATFSWMQPGRVRVSVPRQGADPIVVEAEVREGETTEVTVRR